MPLIIGQETELATPATGFGNVAPKTDSELYYKDDNDVETQLTNQNVSVTGARDTPETALANLLAVLEGLGFIVDNTTAS